MFSAFSESGIQGIEIKAAGQRWYLEEPEDVQAFVLWLNENAAQQSVQSTRGSVAQKGKSKSKKVAKSARG